MLAGAPAASSMGWAKPIPLHKRTNEEPPTDYSLAVSFFMFYLNIFWANSVR